MILMAPIKIKKLVKLITSVTPASAKEVKRRTSAASPRLCNFPSTDRSCIGNPSGIPIDSRAFLAVVCRGSSVNPAWSARRKRLRLAPTRHPSHVQPMKKVDDAPAARFVFRHPKQLVAVLAPAI